jgi:hypothetical protein
MAPFLASGASCLSRLICSVSSVFHRSFGSFFVGAAAAFGGPGGGDFGDDVIQSGGLPDNRDGF